MSDSFFSSRNRYDDQARLWDPVTCREVIECSTRRLAQLQGPLSTAKDHYRLADICAGAHTLPVEFWRTDEAKPDAAAEVAPPHKPSRLDRILSNTFVWFWIGIGTGWLLWAPK